MASTYELVIQAVDQTTRPLNKIEKNLRDIDRQVKGTTGLLKTAGAALAAFVTGGTIRNIVQIGARFEDLRDTLTSVTGSVETGAKAFRGIQQFATQTQFGVEELTQTYIKLAGAGITPTTKLLTTFTDAAAVTTDQLGTLQAITDLFSRTTSGGLGLEELNRLADRGVPVFAILQEKLGLARLEVSEFGKTAEGARKITEALAQGIDERFGGATQSKLDNTSTAMSNFAISVRNTADDIAKELNPAITDVLNQMTALITANKTIAKEIGVGLGDAVKGSAAAVRFLADNFDILRNAVFTAIGAAALNQAFLFFTTLRANAAASGGLIKALGGGIRRLGTSIPILSSVLSLLGRLGPIGAIITALVGTFTYFQDTLVNVGNTTASLGEVAKAVFNLLGDAAQRALNFAIEKFNNFKSSFGSVFEILQKVTKAAFNSIINSVIATFVVIRDTVYNLPKVFRQTFSAIGELATVFGDFLYKKLTLQDAELDFTAAFAKAFAKVEPIVSTNLKEIFAVDRLAQISDGLGEILKSGVEAATPAFQAVTTAIEAQIQADRARLETIKQVNVEQTSTNQLFEDAGKNIIPTVTNSTALLTEENKKAAKSVKAVESAYSKFLGRAQDIIFAGINQENNFKRLNDQYAAGVVSAKLYEQALRLLADDGFDPATQKLIEMGLETDEVTKQMMEKFERASESIATDLARNLAQGKTSLNDFKSFFSKILEDIAAEVIKQRVTKPFVDQVTGFITGGLNSGGGGGGFLDKAISFGKSLFGGRANGGPVTGGSPYVVGERGPELFVPNTTGSIVPREEMGGSNNANITFNIQAFDTKDAVQTLVENRDIITAIVSDSFNKQGRRGIIS